MNDEQDSYVRDEKRIHEIMRQNLGVATLPFPQGIIENSTVKNVLYRRIHN